MNNYFLLGIDYGTKKTGLAIGQSVTRNSRPLKVLYNNYIKEIKNVIDEWDINKIVIGYPEYKEEGSIHKEIKSFAKNIQISLNFDIEIIFYDEFLTSELAKNSFADMRNDGVTRKKSSDYDDISASIILQSWINENIID
jgi:putative Holliday junction resolvase